MIHVTEELVRAVDEERLAAARPNRLAGALRRARRERRVEAAVGQRGRRMQGRREPVTELDTVLRRTAERVAEEGTHSEALTLEAMASAARSRRPGAAAALVDWGGAEIARLRAFGLVHGVLVTSLTSAEEQRLLCRILDVTMLTPPPLLGESRAVGRCRRQIGDPVVAIPRSEHAG